MLVLITSSFQVREHERSVERLRQQYEDCLQDVSTVQNCGCPFIFLSSFKVLSAFLFTPTTVSTSFVDAAEKCRRGWYGSQAKWHEVQIWGIHRQGVMLAIFILFCLFCPTNYLRSGNFKGPASHSSNKQKVQVVEGHFFNSSGKITPTEHEK